MQNVSYPLSRPTIADLMQAELSHRQLAQASFKQYTAATLGTFTTAVTAMALAGIAPALGCLSLSAAIIGSVKLYKENAIYKKQSLYANFFKNLYGNRFKDQRLINQALKEKDFTTLALLDKQQLDKAFHKSPSQAALWKKTRQAQGLIKLGYLTQFLAPSHEGTLQTEIQNSFAHCRISTREALKDPSVLLSITENFSQCKNRLLFNDDFTMIINPLLTENDVHPQKQDLVWRTLHEASLEQRSQIARSLYHRGYSYLKNSARPKPNQPSFSL